MRLCLKEFFGQPYGSNTPLKQIKRIEDQREKQIKAIEEHGKQLVKSNGERESLTLQHLLMTGWAKYKTYVNKLILII